MKKKLIFFDKTSVNTIKAYPLCSLLNVFTLNVTLLQKLRRHRIVVRIKFRPIINMLQVLFIGITLKPQNYSVSKPEVYLYEFRTQQSANITYFVGEICSHFSAVLYANNYGTDRYHRAYNNI